MGIGTKIKKLRKKLGINQLTLADRVGVTPQAVSKWETGETNPSVALIPLLADLLNVTADELLDGGERGEQEPVSALAPGEREAFDALTEDFLRGMTERLGGRFSPEAAERAESAVAAVYPDKGDDRRRAHIAAIRLCRARYSMENGELEDAVRSLKEAKKNR